MYFLVLFKYLCFSFDSLFGPKRKMTSAIARWHSNARPPSDALEQAYADQLEAEMQEMAIQLHKVLTASSSPHEAHLHVKSGKRAAM